jgi:acyl-coenzyme A thioesterase PaaI-like protein
VRHSITAITTVVDDAAAMQARSTNLDRLRRQRHAGCFACDNHAGRGLGLQCKARPDGSVAGDFAPHEWMRGFDERLQGGIVATLLDSAMTQCLFAWGIAAVTVSLEVRFRHPASLHGPFRVSAWLEEKRHNVYCLGAELRQDDRRIATGTARFVQYA